MEKENQNSAFYQNDAFPNLGYDVPQMYRELARPVLCPMMAIPQDILYNIPAFRNVQADLNRRDKIMKSSVQNVFISSTSCFQSYNPYQRSLSGCRYDRKDAAVLTSETNIDENIQKHDVGTPSSKFDTFNRSNRNIQCLYKKDADHYSLKDAKCGDENGSSTLNTTDRDDPSNRDDRLIRLLKKLLAARKREKQFVQNDELIKSLLTKVQEDEELVNDKMSEFTFTEKKKTNKNNAIKNDCEAYYMNRPNILFNPNRRRSNYNCRIRQIGRNCKQYSCRPRESFCYPISSQGRLIMLQKQKQMKGLLQSKKTQESKTCEDSCKRHDFNYYNRKIKGILAKYGESVNCEASSGSNIKKSSVDEKKKNEAMFSNKYDISHPPCRYLPEYSESATSTTVCTEEPKSEHNRSQQLNQEYCTSRQDFNGLETNEVGYVLQNTCDGVKSDSFPYLCNCFKKKIVHDKAILARTCCNNNFKTKSAQTGFSPDDKQNGTWVSKDNVTLQGVPTNNSVFIKRKLNEQYKNDIYAGAADDTVRAIHNEKLKGIFEKYTVMKSDLSNFTFPNLLSGNERNNILHKCDRLCEQIQKQRREVKQLSYKTSDPNNIWLNIIEKLEEVTKHINLFIIEEQRAKQYLIQSQSTQEKPTIWNFNMQQYNRANKPNGVSMSPTLSKHHTGTQFSGNSQIMKNVFQEESNKIKQTKNDVEEIINEILQKVNSVAKLKQRNDQPSSDLTGLKQRLDFSDKSINVLNKHKKMTIAVNTDPLGLVPLLKMSTEALMRFLSYFPAVSSNPIFGIAYKQSVSHYVCNICGAIFQRSSQLSDHIKVQHNFEEIRECCVCRHTLELQQQPVGGLFTCQYCGHHFTRAYCCELHELDCAKKRGIKPNPSSSLALLR